MQIGNKNNNNILRKQPTFGVRKSDSVQSFINEIRTSNPNLGDLERLPIVQKMKESDTFEQLRERANVNRSMFENKRSFIIANERGFATFINSICIKIMNELKELGNTVKKFIVQIEDENGNKKKNDIINAFKKRLYIKAYNENNPEKRKEDNKQYYEDNKDKILEKRKQYYENDKDEILEKHKQYYENNKDKILEKRKKYYENDKGEILEKQKEHHQNNPRKLKINFMSPETQLEEIQSELMPQIPWPQEQEDFEPMSPNFQQAPEDEFYTIE